MDFVRENRSRKLSFLTVIHISCKLTHQLSEIKICIQSKILQLRNERHNKGKR